MNIHRNAKNNRKKKERLKPAANSWTSVLLPTPQAMLAQYPANEKVKKTVRGGKKQIIRIITGRDKRLLAIVGPCSIHNPDEALLYAEKLARAARAVSDRIFVIMRTYIAKPRTTTGWKGLLFDPQLNESGAIDEGLALARKLFLAINQLGLPVGMEILDLISPLYFADLVSWGSLGARTVESQPHREIASGLSIPIGFKNNTSGDIAVAVDAMESAKHSHQFPGIDKNGSAAKISTTGNSYTHIILRGGVRPNYTETYVSQAVTLLKNRGLNPQIVVDSSHANSGKIIEKQGKVLKTVIRQRMGFLGRKPNTHLVGFMLESYLRAGNQKIPKNLQSINELQKGVSVTDPCIGWEETEELLQWVHKTLS